MPVVPLVALVVIAGPQASGKSTLATALAEELRTRGEKVALVELDQIAAMALPTLPDWTTAHRIFESVAGQWLRSELTCVVAEGSGSHDEVIRLVEVAPSSVAVVTVAVTCSVEIAFERAQEDPTRGISRQQHFLEGVYERWHRDLGTFEHDILLDTSDTPVERAVAAVLREIATARQERSPQG